MAEKNIDDLIIIGAGPAGLAASIYASRFGVKHVVLGSVLGGTISETHLIDNYPGVEDMRGFDFSQKWVQHAKKYGTEIISVMVKKIEKKDDSLFEVSLDGDKKMLAKTILLATGTKRKKLGIKGEDAFFGRGVSYCATCDGPFYRDKIVAVIGGSNSAAGAATYLAEIAKKVYLIYRGEKLRAEEYLIKQIEKNEKIELLYKLNVLEVLGTEKVEKIKLDRSHESKDEIELDGLFIEVGSDPSVDFVRDLGMESDEQGYIKVEKDATTSLRGIWAAGDITNGSNKFFQVITAAAEGAVAAKSIADYLRKQ